MGGRATPVPVRGTAWGLSLALSVTRIEALRVPPAVGLNVTLMLHEPDVPKLLGQSFVWAKSWGFVPAMVILEILSVAVPVL